MDLTGADWRKSSYSGGNGGGCVEVARNLPGIIAVRDSKDPQGPALAVTPAQWHALLDSIRADEFSLYAPTWPRAPRR
jgi:Domain of unknown function (DUF397)